MRLIEHVADAPILLARNKHVPLLQGAGLDQQGRDGAPPLFQARFDHKASRRTFGDRFQIQHFRLQQNGIEQLVDSLASLRRYIHEQMLTTPFL